MIKKSIFLGYIVVIFINYVSKNVIFSLDENNFAYKQIFFDFR